MAPNYLQKEEGSEHYKGQGQGWGGRLHCILAWVIQGRGGKLPSSKFPRVHFPKISLAGRRSENGQVRPPNQTLMSTLKSSGNKSYRKETRDISKDKKRNAEL